MKRLLMIIGGIIIILILGGVYLFIYLNKTNLSINNPDTLIFDSSKAVDLGISNIIQNLEECKGSSQAKTSEERNKFQFCSYDISDANLTKLNYIKNLKGNSLCSFDGRNQSNPCNLNNYYNQDSQIIWEFEWSSIGVRQNYHYLMIWKSGDNYYYTDAGNSAAGTPYSGNIYLLENLDEQTINNLKN